MELKVRINVNLPQSISTFSCRFLLILHQLELLTSENENVQPPPLFLSRHFSHFLSFRGEPSATSHQDCLQSNTCPQLLGSETKGTSWVGDGWLVGLCFLLDLHHGCHSLNGLFILWRWLCLVVVILANLYWLLAVCQHFICFTHFILATGLWNRYYIFPIQRREAQKV